MSFTKKHDGWILKFNEKLEPELVCSKCGFEILIEKMDEYENDDEYGFPLSCPKCKTELFIKKKGIMR